MTRLLVLALISASLLVACGGDDSTPAGTTAPPSVTTSSAQAATPSPSPATVAPGPSPSATSAVLPTPAASSTIPPTTAPTPAPTTAPPPPTPAPTQPAAPTPVPTATPAPQLPPPGLVSLIVAAPPNSASGGFDTSLIRVRSGSLVTINFQNNDPGVVHNLGVSAFSNEHATCAGPCLTNLTFTAGAPGKYTFFCNLHDNMFGALIVDP